MSKLREIFKNAGFYEGQCCKCGMALADFNPLPERIICGYCKAVEDKTLATMPTGKVQ